LAIYISALKYKELLWQ